MTTGITTLTRDIADGEVFKHKGPIELNGSIGAGATVIITDGGIRVYGNVGDDARVTANGGHANYSSGNNIVTSGDIVGGRVTYNGRVVSNTTRQNGFSGIVINGNAGARVALTTDGALEIKGDAGGKLQARVDGSVHLNNTGIGLSSRSGGSFHAENIGAGAGITCGGSMHIETLGNSSTANSGGSMHIGTIGAGARANAGGSMKVQLAHSTARLSSGGSKKIGRVSADDADFTLSGAFDGAATPAAKPVAPETPKPPKKPGFNL